MVKCSVTRLSKAQRQQSRSGSTLHSRIVTPKTLQNYSRACGLFLDWLSANSMSMPRCYLHLDELLAQWVEAIYQEGEPLGLAGQGLSGMQHFMPFLRHHLPCSWRLYGAWQRHELPAQAPPFTDLLIAGLVGLSLSIDDLPMAASLALAFHAYLRSGELFALRCGHVMSDGASGGVHLPVTKKGIRDSVSIDDPLVARLVAHRLAHSQPGDLFIHRSSFRARRDLALLLQFFQLHDVGYRFYSCRRGGATADFRASGLMERVLVRGRWESSRTARIYITDGIGSLLQLQMGSSKQRELMYFAERWAAM